MTLPEPVAVAVDVGGTCIKAALVDTSGAILVSRRSDTGVGRGPEAVVATIVSVAGDLTRAARTDGLDPVACGVVVAAVVDEPAGVLTWSANLGLRDVALRDLVVAETGLPTALGHDVRAGALAEALYGAGRSTRRLLFVAIGTGIAGGYVVDGRVDSGAHGAGGEIGHIRVRGGADARPCSCGGAGCVEIYASAAAIARAYGEPAEVVARRFAAGEPRAAEVWLEAIEALADGLLIGIALHDPHTVALGGGLSGAGDILLDPLRAALERKRTFHRLPELVCAELGDEAGQIGAALLALDLVGVTP
jgi:glucokinase